MKILTLLSQKGGSGKTSLCVHLAGLAMKEGAKSVALIDTDPQRSLRVWWKRRVDPEPLLIERGASELGAVLEAARHERIDLAMIDTPPHAKKEAFLAASASDFVLIPARPSLLDLHAISASVQIVKKASVHGSILLNACPPPRGAGCHPSIVKEAREGLKGYGMEVCPFSVSMRASFSHALLAGSSIVEFEPNGKSALELRQIWRWLSEHKHLWERT